MQGLKISLPQYKLYPTFHYLVIEENNASQPLQGLVDLRLKVRGIEESLVAGLLADDTVMLAENERTLQMLVDESDRVCKRRKLRMNAGRSKVMVSR